MFSRWSNRKRVAALDKLWDQLLVADGSRPPGAIESPADAEAIAIVMVHDDAPPIDRGYFFATLQRDLMEMHTVTYGDRTNHIGTPGRTVRREIWTPAGPMDRGFAGIARPRFAVLVGSVVLVLLIALGISTLWIGGSEEPKWIPAAVLQDDNEVKTEVLLDVSFPAGQLRGAEDGLVIYSQSLVPPHTMLGFAHPCDPDDVVTFVVTEGTMTISVKSASAILREGASQWETIPGGVTVEIGAGDAWFFENRAVDGVTAIGNLADDDLRFIWVAVRGNKPDCTSGPPSGITEEWIYLEPNSGYLDPTQPVRMVLQSVTLADSATVDETLGSLDPPSEEQVAMGARQWTAVLDGTLTVTTIIDGEENPLVHRWQSGRTLTQDDVRSRDDRTITFSHESGQPVELLVLDIAVGDPEADGGAQVPMIASPIASPVTGD